MRVSHGIVSKTNMVLCVLLNLTATSPPLGPSPLETLICSDEAYVELLTADIRFDALDILSKFGKPYIVMRTFSKAYGLAGVRIGYAICSDAQLINAMMQTPSAFGVNALAATDAAEAIRDTDHLDKVVVHATFKCQTVTAAMDAKGIGNVTSHSNCVFCDTGADAGILAEKMWLIGIMIKAWKETLYENRARDTMGTTRENDLFLAAL